MKPDTVRRRPSPHRSRAGESTARRQVAAELQSAVSLLTATLDSTADGILVVGADHKISLFNQRFVEMWGIPEKIMSSRDDDRALAFVLEQLIDPAGFVAKVDELYGQPAAESFDVLHFKDGRTFERYSRPQLVDGVATGRVWSFRDITIRQRAVAALEESDAKFRAVFDQSPVAFSLLALPDRRLVEINDACLAVFGYRRDEVALLAADAAAWAVPDEREFYFSQLQTAGSIRDYETLMRRKDGEIFHATLTGSRVVLGGRQYSLNALQDTSERKRLDAKLLHDAFHDELTGLPNRALFMDRLRQAIERSRREPAWLAAVLFLDLDDFKTVNDSLGHLVGDQVLIRIAASLATALRPTDTLARLGGDEFAVLLEGHGDVSDAVRVAERLHGCLHEPVQIGRTVVFASLSIGIAVHTLEYRRPENLLRDADTAMYRAKCSGRARSVVFNRAMHRIVLARRRLETDLRRAVDEGELRLQFQPFVDLGTDEVVGFEALVRWRHPRRGLLAPAEFLAAAEQTGLIVPIGRYVLAESCRRTAELQRRHPRPLRLTVNLSYKELFEVDLPQQIGTALADSGLDPGCLGLEITEGVILHDAEAATQRFALLKSLGVQLYLDDFGKGYSSLSYLHLFPMDLLKIDRSFISRLAKAERNFAIVRAIVTLAHQLGMAVVAEGIETAEQQDRLHELGCEYGQGFFFSKPVSADGLETLLKRGRRSASRG